MATTFDPKDYDTLPTADAAGTHALVLAILSATPANASSGVQKASASLKATDDALAKVLAAEAGTGTNPAAQAADRTIDTAWSALSGRLDDYCRLPSATFPKVARAEALRALLFPQKLSFLSFKYLAEWTESDAILKRIGEQNLQPDIDALCGPEFLPNVKTAHDAYGVALGITQKQATAAPASVQEPLKAVRAELARYARALVAMADEDPTRTADVVAGFLPIDQLRARQSAASRKTNPAPAAAAPGAKVG